MKDAALTLMDALFDVSRHVHIQRLPELLSGFPKRRNEAPTAYPVACSPQAWAVASVYSLLQSVLSLKVDALEKEVVFRRPVLPPWLEVVHIDHLPVGDSYIKLDIRRYGDDLGILVDEKPSDWSVIVEK